MNIASIGIDLGKTTFHLTQECVGMSRNLVMQSQGDAEPR
jgi:hypothetical protein